MERLIIVTGASRGIGSTIAKQANQKFKSNSIFLLIARDEKKLSEVKDEMMSESPLNKIIPINIDFGIDLNKNEIINIIKKYCSELEMKNIKELFIFYNHGTLSLKSIESAEETMKKEFQINVFSLWTLISVFKELFPLEMIPLQFHINISSLMATLVLKNYSAYCTSNVLILINLNIKYIEID